MRSMKISSFKIIFFFLFFNILPFFARADFKIIYDAETQNVINEIAKPIFAVAGLKKPQIYIVDDNTPNAFTTGGESIYINTGLIIKFDDPNVLRGVIAHEVGHITAKHAQRLQTYAIDQQKIATTSMILGLAGAVMTGNPILAMQGAVIGSHTAERNWLKYSRENESSADIKAQEYLHKTGYNSEGLIQLLQYFQHQHNIRSEFRYDLTHPISSERIEFIKSNKKNLKPFIEEAELKEKYQMVIIKLTAFTSAEFIHRQYSQNALRYNAAILGMKKSDKGTALNNINELIATDGTNPYYHQLKGEILCYFGDVAALDSYKLAASILPDELLKIEYAIAQIKLSNNPLILNEALATLEFSSPNYLMNNTVLSYLALGYDKVGKSSYSIYYRALQQKNLGNIKLATKLAEQAKKNLPQNSPLYIKVDDIIRTKE